MSVLLQVPPSGHRETPELQTIHPPSFFEWGGMKGSLRPCEQELGTGCLLAHLKAPEFGEGEAAVLNSPLLLFP